jgi:hypothetical protein
MDAIIPLMPESAAVMNTPTGATALTRLFSALRAATALDRVLAVGNDAGLLALAENAGLSAVLLAAPQPLRSGGPLPTGGAEALDRLGTEDRRTLLVSCANPLLSGQIIDDFVRQAEAAQRPMVSAVAPLDHPCQLSQHLRMLDAGVLLPLDPHADAQASNGGARLRTKPFRFLWTTQQTRGQGPLFVLGCAQGESFFLSVPDEAAMPASGPLLLRESEDSARLSLPADEIRELAARFGVQSLSDVTAVGLHLSPGLPCISFRDADGVAFLGFAASHEGRRLCQVYAQAGHGGQGGQDGECRASLDLTDEPPRAALPWTLGAMAAPVSYNLLDYLDRDGGFDLTQAFPEAHHGLWRVDPATGCRVNCISGRVIHGRQEFPEVLEPDGSLSALTRTEAARFDELLQAGEVAAYVLERGQSLQLRTPFDLLRYKAKLRMEEA